MPLRTQPLTLSRPPGHWRNARGISEVSLPPRPPALPLSLPPRPPALPLPPARSRPGRQPGRPPGRSHQVRPWSQSHLGTRGQGWQRHTRAQCTMPDSCKRHGQGWHKHTRAPCMLPDRCSCKRHGSKQCRDLLIDYEWAKALPSEPRSIACLKRLKGLSPLLKFSLGLLDQC